MGLLGAQLASSSQVSYAERSLKNTYGANQRENGKEMILCLPSYFPAWNGFRLWMKEHENMAYKQQDPTLRTLQKERGSVAYACTGPGVMGA